MLTSGDLQVVNVAADSSLALIPGSSESSVLGQPVALPLVAGSLTTADVGTDRMPPAGWAVVGVALKAGQYPPEVSPGDRVMIVTTAGTGTTGGTGPIGTAPPTTATVVGVQVAPVDSSAATVVSLQVPEADSAAVAAAASNGAVSLVLVSERGGTP